jgi:hypothetical protein
MDDFAIIYMDDILVYSKMAEEHAIQLEVVLRNLGTTSFMQLVKSEFAQLKIEFLGHVVIGDGIKLDMKKAKAIRDYMQPSMQKNLRVFLGLENYEMRFICNLSKISKPLSDLLKKGISQVWDDFC